MEDCRLKDTIENITHELVYDVVHPALNSSIIYWEEVMKACSGRWLASVRWCVLASFRLSANWWKDQMMPWCIYELIESSPLLHPPLSIPHWLSFCQPHWALVLWFFFMHAKKLIKRIDIITWGRGIRLYVRFDQKKKTVRTDSQQYEFIHLSIMTTVKF